MTGLYILLGIFGYLLGAAIIGRCVMYRCGDGGDPLVFFAAIFWPASAVIIAGFWIGDMLCGE